MGLSVFNVYSFNPASKFSPAEYGFIAIWSIMFQLTIREWCWATTIESGPRQANLVLIAYASSEGSSKPADPRSLARTFAARSYKQWIKRNIQTESQIPGPLWMAGHAQLKFVMTECSKTQIHLTGLRVNVACLICEQDKWYNHNHSFISCNHMSILPCKIICNDDKVSYVEMAYYKARKILVEMLHV